MVGPEAQLGLGGGGGAASEILFLLSQNEIKVLPVIYTSRSLPLA